VNRYSKYVPTGPSGLVRSEANLTLGSRVRMPSCTLYIHSDFDFHSNGVQWTQRMPSPYTSDASNSKAVKENPLKYFSTFLLWRNDAWMFYPPFLVLCDGRADPLRWAYSASKELSHLSLTRISKKTTAAPQQERRKIFPESFLFVGRSSLKPCKWNINITHAWWRQVFCIPRVHCTPVKMTIKITVIIQRT